MHAWAALARPALKRKLAPRAPPLHAKQVDISLSRIAALNKPELHFFVLGSMAAACTGAVQPIFSFLLASFINLFLTTAPVRCSAGLGLLGPWARARAAKLLGYGSSWLWLWLPGLVLGLSCHWV